MVLATLTGNDHGAIPLPPAGGVGPGIFDGALQPSVVNNDRHGGRMVLSLQQQPMGIIMGIIRWMAPGTFWKCAGSDENINIKNRPVINVALG